MINIRSIRNSLLRNRGIRINLRLPLSLLFIGLSFSCKPQNPEHKSPAKDKEVVCFVYHRFGDPRYPTTNVSVKDFDAHLAYLVKNNFRVVTFSEAISYLQSEQPVQKTAVITIDDGYQSFFKNGLPLLKKYSMPATLFINTKTVGGGDYMNWSALEAAMKSNIEIGNHTHSHDYFLNESSQTRYKTFKDEIELSQSIIFENLHIKPVVFSFPYGEFDLKMKKIAAEAGFNAAAAQNSGVIHSGTDFFMCPRFPMSEVYADPAEFGKKASMKALRISSELPLDFILPANKQPLLELTIDNTDLLLDRIQCFVQGGECDMKIIRKDEKKAMLTIRSAKAITKRRRTLYTITVPDKNGVWHWYSRLWIDPGRKE
jgi:peptidoglycan/xylan/chitin deacetylase (PgdA/CDA1 family)